MNQERQSQARNLGPKHSVRARFWGAFTVFFIALGYLFFEFSTFPFYASVVYVALGALVVAAAFAIFQR